MRGRGRRAGQATRPLQLTVRILLECILVPHISWLFPFQTETFVVNVHTDEITIKKLL